MGGCDDVVGWGADSHHCQNPLTDFDLADDNADLPAGFGLYLIYRLLANDWADNYGLPLEGAFAAASTNEGCVR